MSSPSVAILLAVYNPRVDWLCELLDSLNRQTYPNLHLYVRNDGSTKISMEELESLIGKHITAFPVTLLCNEQNVGSNATFARLTEDACEDLVAYCDQDDVWLPEKIENTVHLLLESPLSPRLVCTNVRVIDGEGKPIADRIENHRRRHIFLRGEGLGKELIYRNFVIGCTAVLRRADAVRYLPFPTMEEAVHDHYLAFCAASEGAIDYLCEPQMLYRVYGGNQTGVMSGVRTREDYLRLRIEGFSKRVACFSAVHPSPELEDARQWCEARRANLHRERGSFSALWRMRRHGKSVTLFELIALRLPAPLFRLAIRTIQKGWL